MNREHLIAEISQIFNDILDTEGLNLTENSTADDVEGWDSLTHVQLVVAIEKHFKCRFTSREIQDWKNVGELADCIRGKV